MKSHSFKKRLGTYGEGNSSPGCETQRRLLMCHGKALRRETTGTVLGKHPPACEGCRVAPGLETRCWPTVQLTAEGVRNHRPRHEKLLDTTVSSARSSRRRHGVSQVGREEWGEKQVNSMELRGRTVDFGESGALLGCAWAIRSGSMSRTKVTQITAQKYQTWVWAERLAPVGK